MCGSPQTPELPQLAVVMGDPVDTSMNSIRGLPPPYGQQTGAFVDGTKLRLFDSPVVPPLNTHVGALCEPPSVTATCTQMEAPLLNTACEPPAFPTTLNSAWFQT